METVGTVIGIAAGIVAIIGGLIGLWIRLRKTPDAKPSARAAEGGIATSGESIDSTLTAGGQPTVAKESGVAIGPGHTGPITVIQQGPDKETQALAAEATEEAERLLDEALELQRQHQGT